MSYRELIRQLAPQYDPADIEAWLRVEWPTLDGMSAAQFAQEVKTAVACLLDASPDMTARLRTSFGL